MAEDKANQDQQDKTNWLELGLEGASHGLFVELPTSLATLVDWGSMIVNNVPRIWGSEKIVDEPLKYAPGVRKGAQSVYDTVNDWTDYTPPVPQTNREKIVYGAAELGGQFLLPTGLAAKGTEGLISALPKGLTLSKIASPSFLAGSTVSLAKTGVSTVVRHPILAGAAAVDGYYNDFGATKWLSETFAEPAAASLVYTDPKERERKETQGPDSEVAPQNGPLQNARNKAGDKFRSNLLDPIEDATGFDIPDGWEETLHKLTGWFGEGSTGSMLALGLTTLLGSNMILDKMIGDSTISGLLSVGLAIAAVYFGPKMMQSFNASANPVDTAENKSEAPKPTLNQEPRPKQNQGIMLAPALGT